MIGFQPPAAMAEGLRWHAGDARQKYQPKPLAAALERVELGGQPEDAARLPGNKEMLQSMDGFPA